MKILKTEDKPKVKLRQTIQHENDIYVRIEFVNNTVEWHPHSFDGEIEDGLSELEKEYQKLINKPVETTNEQPIYSIKVKNEIFELEYEEMVEIFSVFRHKKKGNEYYESAMNKAKQIFDKLPITDY